MEERPRTSDERSHEERMVMHEYARKVRVKRWMYWGSLGVFVGGICLCIVAAVTGIFVFKNREVYLVLISLGLLMLLGVGVAQMIYWRCPQCRGQFRAQRNPRFCSNCGVRLRE
jgi:hypothetical protein